MTRIASFTESWTKEEMLMENWEAPVAQEAEAAPGGWFSCDVIWTGPIENGQVSILLREEGGQFEQWYHPVSIVQKEMLAVALTAMTTGFRVQAALSTTDEGGPIERLYLKRYG
jgi:hypothetical protein